MTTLRALLLASLQLTLLSAPAWAQDEEAGSEETTSDDPLAPDEPAPSTDDDLDEILGEKDPNTSTVAEERREFERDADVGRDRVEELELPPPEKRLIKTLQKKNILKLGRFEAMPYVGYVPNDPFIHRIMFGLGLGYHITEIFEIELQGSVAPNFDRGDWKPVTTEIFENKVAPKISRQIAHALVNLNFAPFYGKIATRKSSILFDIYGTFGFGFVYTEDDLAVIHGEFPPPEAFATERQVHPALSAGGGLRVAFNKTFALRFEGRTISYIGVLDSSEHEVKNNLALLLGASIFFGRRIE
ncbi:MAG: outer membrane beta-barrel domain-containing protein [Alphaproteobacteria bacterium]|nr:outer membrane beta-barrel domain-containing protein [Alphaproteobacteria bacterium]